MRTTFFAYAGSRYLGAHLNLNAYVRPIPPQATRSHPASRAMSDLAVSGLETATPAEVTATPTSFAAAELEAPVSAAAAAAAAAGPPEASVEPAAPSATASVVVAEPEVASPLTNEETAPYVTGIDVPVPKKRPEKVIWFVRHAQSNNNVYRSFFHSSEIPWTEPYDFDTRLSLEGRRHAESIAYALARIKPRPEVLVVSPLTRTLETAELAFSGFKDLPRRVAVVSRERLLFSGEVGSSPGALAAEWPQYDFTSLPDMWWYPQKPDDPYTVVQEPYDVFLARCRELLVWLGEQPESVIALVGHSLVFQHITGHSFGNTEVRAYKLDHLRVRNYLTKTMTDVWAEVEEPLCPNEAAKVQPHMYK